MKKLVCLIGLLIVVGCISKAHALPGKRIIYGQNNTSTNTYRPVAVNSDGSLVTTSSGTFSVTGSTVNLRAWDGSSWVNVPVYSASQDALKVGITGGSRQAGVLLLNGDTISETNSGMITVSAIHGKSVSTTTWEPLNMTTDGYVKVETGTGSVVNDFRYDSKVSSGTSGLITGTDTSSIVVSDNVVSWSFVYSNSSDTANFGTIKPSIWGTDISLKDGQSHSEDVVIPAPITFTLANLTTNATVQYTIQTIK